jgi:hypothetical protein
MKSQRRTVRLLLESGQRILCGIVGTEDSIRAEFLNKQLRGRGTLCNGITFYPGETLEQVFAREEVIPPEAVKHFMATGERKTV